MEGAGHLRRIAVAAVALSLAGCAWGKARARDFGDIFRFEVQGGYGLQVHANAGELAHVGVGSSHHWSAGWVYGKGATQETIEDHIPLSVAWSFVDPEHQHLHRMKLGYRGEHGTHRCYSAFPGALNPGTVEKSDINYLDVEVGFLAGFFGIEVGFSIGEFIDFFLGIFRWDDSWTACDIAGDDPEEEREFKRLWLKKLPREGLFLPE